MDNIQTNGSMPNGQQNSFVHYCPKLTECQKTTLSNMLKEYLTATEDRESFQPFVRRESINKDRLEATKTIGAILADYLSEISNFNEFVSNIGKNKKCLSLWGFDGYPMMWLNKFSKEGFDKYSKDIRLALTLPKTIGEMRNRLESFEDDVLDYRVKGRDWLYIISFLWQTQAPDTYPAIQKSSLEILEHTKIPLEDESMRNCYTKYYCAYNEMIPLFTDAFKEIYNKPYAEGCVLYHIEHALHYANPTIKTPQNAT